VNKCLAIHLPRRLDLWQLGHAVLMVIDELLRPRRRRRLGEHEERTCDPNHVSQVHVLALQSVRQPGDPEGR
jgi:hypothetical protein